MLPLNETDLHRTIDSRTLQRGRELLRSRRVLNADIGEDGNSITARVQGSRPQPYRLLITLRKGLSGTIAHGTCSCPMQSNCKHVAAVLYQVLKQAKTTDCIERVAAWNGLICADPDDDMDCDPDGEVTGIAPARRAAAPAVADTCVLSHAQQNWLEEFTKAQTPARLDEYPPHVTQRLIYVLDRTGANTGKGTSARVNPVTAALTKAGTFSKPKPYPPHNIFQYQPASHVRPADLSILSRLHLIARQAHSGFEAVTLTASSDGKNILQEILATGRCRWGDVNGPVLAAGPARRGAAVWQRAARGGQRLGFVFADGPEGEQPALAAAVLPITPPHYVDPEAGCVGPLDLGLPDALAQRLAEMPELSLASANRFAASLGERLEAMGLTGRIPMPDTMANIETRLVQPVPRLELFTADVRLKPHYGYYGDRERLQAVHRLPFARASFDYAGEVVTPQSSTEMIERSDGDKLIFIPRQHKAELGHLQRLFEAGFDHTSGTPLKMDKALAETLFLVPEDGESHYDFLKHFDDPGRFIGFAMTELPNLIEAGWQISYSDDYPYRIAEGEASWWADIGEGSGIDWFSFELGVEFEGHRLNLIPHLTNVLAQLPPGVAKLALSANDEEGRQFVEVCRSMRLFHTLPDGRLLPLPGERLAPMLKSLLELVGPHRGPQKDGKLRLSRAEAAALHTFADQSRGEVAWAASTDRLVALGRDLKRGRSLEKITPPKSFKANLRPYQSDGLAWLDFLRATGFGGVLADDMGLGKTVQALAFLSREKAARRLDRPALIVAPTSVLPNWQAEAERFAPSLKVLTLRGPERQERFSRIPEHDLVLTTYPLLARDHGVILEQDFHAAILDEAQAIKNPKATVSGLAHRIRARHRFALTGTPLENNLGEVWSLFEFLSPGLLGDESTFRRTFRTPIEKHGDAAAQAFLSRRLKPFMLRRTKSEVATELPPKTEIVEHIRLEGAQRDLYEIVRSLMHKRVREEIDKKGLAKSHIIFLDALLKLRQVCCDPRLLKMAQAKKVKSSAKFERLMEMVPEMIGEGRRILLFSQFTSMLELIEAELKALKIPYVTLTGSTVDRAAPVKAFQSGKVPLFLLSLKAGGTGLNLTAADTVIHYDPWWNPAVENQATDRAHRIGQDKPVFVYKLIVEEGIETAIELLKARKAALAEALFAGVSKTGLDLTEADIAALFAPLSGRLTKRAA